MSLRQNADAAAVDEAARVLTQLAAVAYSQVVMRAASGPVAGVCTHTLTGQPMDPALSARAAAAASPAATAELAELPAPQPAAFDLNPLFGRHAASQPAPADDYGTYTHMQSLRPPLPASPFDTARCRFGGATSLSTADFLRTHAVGGSLLPASFAAGELSLSLDDNEAS